MRKESEQIVIDFIANLKDDFEKQVMTIFAAWISDANKGKLYALERIYVEIMNADANGYVASKKYQELECASGSFCRLLSYKHLCALFDKINKAFFDGQQNFESNFITIFNNKKNRCKFAHDALAIMFSGDTLFETRKNNCSFYRYNLMFYYLTEKLNLWEKAKDVPALLPCNDKIFVRANKYGLTEKRLPTTIRGAELLTKYAKQMYGEEFYQLYENLKYD